MEKHSTDIRFNNYTADYLVKNISSGSRLLFINAPGLGGEENYLANILTCFSKIGIKFAEILDLNIDTSSVNVKNFIQQGGEIVYFLMGGNPLAQMEIIKKFDLSESIKIHEGLVVGFCAGAINLSKYSIITSDDDFDHPQSYRGIGRMPIVVEPHYNDDSDMARNEEINDFAREYGETIYAIPDDSAIVVEDNSVKEFGKIYHFPITS